LGNLGQRGCPFLRLAGNCGEVRTLWGENPVNVYNSSKMRLLRGIFGGEG